MSKIDAVGLMRGIRQGLETRYAGLTMAELVARIHSEVEADPAWSDLIRRHRQPAP